MKKLRPTVSIVSVRGTAGSSFSAGFTMVELVIAAGLATLLMAAVIGLLDSALNLWTKGEVKRVLVEQSAGIAERIAADFRSLHPGAQGDLLAEWVAFDADGDGIRERFWPRVRLVRQASAAEIASLEASPADRLSAFEQQLEAQAKAGARVQTASDSSKPSAAASEEDFQQPEQLTRRPPSKGLIEVVWCITPDGKQPDQRETGLLWRQERLLSPEGESFFAPGFFGPDGRPPVGELEIQTGGILWCGLAFATQLTTLEGGWSLGPDFHQASAAWDAWDGGRPDADIHEWNETNIGMPKAGARPLLPRRVRLEFEFEGPGDRKRRARTAESFDAVATSFDVNNGEHLPDEDSYVLVGAEWMRITSVHGDRVSVRRGQRGTAPVEHQSGEMLHHGVTVTTEIPIRVHVGVWNY